MIFSFVWYKNLDRSFFHFVTRLTDGRTDGQLSQTVSASEIRSYI